MGGPKTDQLVRELAGCLKDGEDDGSGGTFVMENDDAVDTLHSFISQARHILGLPQFNEPKTEEEEEE